MHLTSEFSRLVRITASCDQNKRGKGAREAEDESFSGAEEVSVDVLDETTVIASERLIQICTEITLRVARRCMKR